MLELEDEEGLVGAVVLDPLAVAAAVVAGSLAAAAVAVWVGWKLMWRGVRTR